MVNNKQFVIAKKGYAADGFITINLKDGYVLSYQKNLKVYLSKGNRQGVLIGMVWQCDEKRKTPFEELDRLTHEDKIEVNDIYEMEKTWCGRYVLIVGNTIYLDAAGLLGIFYANDVLSSSYAILCDIVKIKDKYPDKTFGIGMCYQPGTLTMHKSIKRLLPTQVYDFAEKKLFYRNLISDNEIFDYCSKQSMDIFIQHFKTSLLNMQKAADGDLWLSLTGGHDSRTLMALLEYAGIKYNCFTLDVSNLTSGDRDLPKLLAKQQKHPFSFIKRSFRNFSARRLKEYLLHSNGFAKDEDICSYTFGQYQKLTESNKEVVILRGGLWEVCRKFFREYADEKDSLNIDLMKKTCPRLAEDRKAVISLLSYLEYIKKHKEKYIDEIDRFYWEIRVGCWLSSIEQSCDIMDHITFLQPCNSRVLLALLCALAKEEKEPWEKKHQEKIIEKICPELLRIDFENKSDDKQTFMKKIYTRVFNYLKWLCLYGFKGVFVAIYAAIKSKYAKG